MIEALCENGEVVVDLIREWKSSSDSHQSFRNYMLKTRDAVRSRPERMDVPVHELMVDFGRRLHIEESDTPKSDV